MMDYCFGRGKREKMRQGEWLESFGSGEADIRGFWSLFVDPAKAARRKGMWGFRFVLIAAVLLGVNVSQGRYSGGTGEPNNPYRIATPNDLNDIGSHIEDYNKCFVMVADIDLSFYDGRDGRPRFSIIGYRDYWGTYFFQGRFDGNDHVVSGFNYESSGEYYFGLFGGSSGTIINLTLENVDVNIVDGENDYVGGLVGNNGGLVNNCHLVGEVSGAYCVGGLVGTNNWQGRIVDCSSIVTVAGVDYVGGLVGENSGSANGDYWGHVLNLVALQLEA
jgi:hypothetical protein